MANISVSEKILFLRCSVKLFTSSEYILNKTGFKIINKTYIKTIYP